MVINFVNGSFLLEKMCGNVNGMVFNASTFGATINKGKLLTAFLVALQGNAATKFVHIAWVYSSIQFEQMLRALWDAMDVLWRQVLGIGRHVCLINLPGFELVGR